MAEAKTTSSTISLSPAEILQDYRLAALSRQLSLAGRREVMSGKAKFGIFGDGKEVAQVAWAKAFRKGDFRSGYYRGQTFMLATRTTSAAEFFAQLYAHADVQAEPASGGRMMNNHFATRSLHPDGNWKDLTEIYNSAADVSPTGSQMPRLVGLAWASKLYRQLPQLSHLTQFSKNGDEVAFGAIGNASCAEGMFWEAINAIGVLRVPAVISIWDDSYGISVANEYQIAKENITELLSGFRRPPGVCCDGLDVYEVRGWDYLALVKAYREAAKVARLEHMPSIIHVTELTQPQGHSTSGSHERYKSKERLEWEAEFDCLKKFREWILVEGIASPAELDRVEAEETHVVEQERKKAWEVYLSPILQERKQLAGIIEEIAHHSSHASQIEPIRERLLATPNPLRRDLMVAVRDVLLTTREEDLPGKRKLIEWKKAQQTFNEQRYGSHLHSASAKAALIVPEVEAIYSVNSPSISGFEVLNACFDSILERDPRVIAFGEDVGKLGDVNQAFRGLQAKYGELRVADTGIRETTILGQAIGLAMRGLRPIAEIQYLDYILYALQIMSDDLATLHWRTAGGQKAPVIVRTRGHRLEGVWHSGSPMAGILNLLRGMYVCVPRNMTQAAGFYNTLLLSDDPALVVEVLNGYRLKETLPDNIGEFTVPLGVPEFLRAGNDATIVTYGACCQIALEAAELLSKVDIQAEVIDVQTLLPFDVRGLICESLQKTGRVLFLDEDVPGGTTAYMLQKVLEDQNGYQWLDSPPRTLPAQPHRPAYGSDGDYFSKPNIEQVFEAVYGMMNESEPTMYPLFYQ
jgi:pyruvate/2-oxoglutarate/acetoin dehydrogenase E1 component/TPP-dependent pyruvate/acetoin dehydrogenase alpha subunit